MRIKFRYYPLIIHVLVRSGHQLPRSRGLRCGPRRSAESSELTPPAAPAPCQPLTDGRAGGAAVARGAAGEAAGGDQRQVCAALRGAAGLEGAEGRGGRGGQRQSGKRVVRGEGRPLQPGRPSQRLGDSGTRGGGAGRGAWVDFPWGRTRCVIFFRNNAATDYPTLLLSVFCFVGPSSKATD